MPVLKKKDGMFCVFGGRRPEAYLLSNLNNSYPVIIKRTHNAWAQYLDKVRYPVCSTHPPQKDVMAL